MKPKNIQSLFLAFCLVLVLASLGMTAVLVAAAEFTAGEKIVQSNTTMTAVSKKKASLPDLTITGRKPKLSVKKIAAGGKVTISGFTIKNIGMSAAGKFNNGYYLSKNRIIRNTDTRLAKNNN